MHIRKCGKHARKKYLNKNTCNLQFPQISLVFWCLFVLACRLLKQHSRCLNYEKLTLFLLTESSPIDWLKDRVANTVTFMLFLTGLQVLSLSTGSRGNFAKLLHPPWPHSVWASVLWCVRLCTLLMSLARLMHFFLV